MSSPPIRITSQPLTAADLSEFVGNPHVGMVKFVVDVSREVVAVGGELHADAEALLLDADSEQSDLWGGNYHPGRGLDACIEFSRSSTSARVRAIAASRSLRR